MKICTTHVDNATSFSLQHMDYSWSLVSAIIIVDDDENRAVITNYLCVRVPALRSIITQLSVSIQAGFVHSSTTASCGVDAASTTLPSLNLPIMWFVTSAFLTST